MATMLPPYVSSEIKSQAEKRVFELLRDDPDTVGWIVLHSLSLSRHAYKRYGELDFVVLVPDGAIVCLEVKGGRISCHDGIWETTNRYNELQYLKESPFEQAKTGMFALRAIVRAKATNGCHLSEVAHGYGVLFPNTNWEHNGTEYEDWQVYHRGYIGPISKFIKGIVNRNADVKSGFSRPTKDDVAKLRQFLRPDFESPISSIGQIETNERELLQLTEEQYEILDSLEGNPRLVIEGAAGTGKTLIAIEAARRAAAEGNSVLLVCFNRLLGHWIESRIKVVPQNERIVAANFHRFLERDIIAKGSLVSEFVAAKTKKMGTADEGRFFREDYPLYSLDALGENVLAPFDLVIVDEGQDLIHDEALMVFDNLVRGGLAGGQWMLFADFNRQAIFAGGLPAEQMRAELQKRAHFATFHLKRNCRNTRRIGRETALLSGFEQLPFSLHAQDGASVDYRFYDNNRKQRKIVGEIIGKLLDEGLDSSDILLISPVRREKSCIAEPIEELDKRGISIALLSETNLLQTPPKTVLFSTLQSFKGLERRAVIVVGINHLDDESFRAGLYVAMSRPTTRLYVLLSEAVRNEYNDLVRFRQQWQMDGEAREN